MNNHIHFYRLYTVLLLFLASTACENDQVGPITLPGCPSLQAIPIPGQFIIKLGKGINESEMNSDELISKIRERLLEWHVQDNIFTKELLRNAEVIVCPNGLILFGLRSIPPDFQERVAKASTRADENSQDEIGAVGQNFHFYIRPYPAPLSPLPYKKQNYDQPTIDKKFKDQIVVAIVDSGVDYNHPRLRKHIWVNPGEKNFRTDRRDNDDNGFKDDWIGYDFAVKKPDPLDQLGHGTHLNGIIADSSLLKEFQELNTHLQLMNLKISDENGITSLFDASCAIAYAVDQRADVINLSWGFYAGVEDTLVTNIVKETLLDAMAAGITVVASAGNDNLDTEECTHWPSGFPLDNIISVAALDKLEDGVQEKIAGYSNDGEISIDFAAPGTDIKSTFPYSTSNILSGTSMATAYVTRLVALRKAQGVSAPRDIKEKLRLSGTSLDPQHPKRVSTKRWLE